MKLTVHKILEYTKLLHLIFLLKTKVTRKIMFRYVEDMRIKGFCPSAEMVPAADPRDSDRNYENGDIVRVAILEVITGIFLCLKRISYPFHFRGGGIPLL